jgi:putative tricarboxylic transport membrane protein
VQSSDRTTGAVLVALGTLAAWGGSRLPNVPGQDVGPAAFPMLIGAGLVLCGVLIALGIGRSFEAPEPTDGAPPPSLPLLRVLVPPGLLVFYVLAIDRLGFLVTAAIVVFAAALALGARPRLAVPLALLAPPLVHLAFGKVLSVPLPAGLVPPPW